MDAERRSDDSKVNHPGLTLFMVAFSTAWFIIVIRFGEFAESDGMPYGTWWILWSLIAVAAVPVFVALWRLAKQPNATYSGLAVGVTFMLPPVLAIGLLMLAAQCANMAAITGRSGGDSCSSHPVAIGWVWLWVGFGILWAMAAYVLRTDRTD
mgnify:CR=1 FL=1